MLHLAITDNNAYFAYQLLWLYMAHEGIISETLKTMLHLAITYRERTNMI